MSDLSRALIDAGWADAVLPADHLQYQEALRRVVDPTGRILETAAKPFRTPVGFRWGPGDTGRWPMIRAGMAVLLRAFATTAPSSGNATVTMTWVSESTGGESLTLTIPQGRQFREVVIAAPIPAGAWVGATVTTANGASGVSIGATIETGVAL